MQFHHDNAKIHTMFNEFVPNRKLVIIPNITLTDRKGWNRHNSPYEFDRFDGNEAIHLTIVKIYTSYFETQSLGNPVDAPDTYNVVCKLHDSAGSLYYEYITLDAYFIHQDNIWHFSLQILPEGLEDDNTGIFCTPLEDYAIHDIVMVADKNSVPTLCAATCAKRATKIEKATFAAVLARRIGNTLANDLTQMMFPKIDKCTSKHSLLDYL